MSMEIIGSCKSCNQIVSSFNIGSFSNCPNIGGTIRCPDCSTMHTENDIYNKKTNKYKVITLCGSMKYKEKILKIQKILTLQGNVVLSPSIFEYSKLEDQNIYRKKRLKDIQRQKIDMADFIFVIDDNNCLENEIKEEIEYAISKYKKVKYLSNDSTLQRLCFLLESL